MMDNKLVKLAFLKTFTKEEIQNIIKKNPDMAYELIKTKLIRGQYSLSPQLYIIEYATKEFLKEHQDLVELAVNNGYKISTYVNKESIDYTINEIIATNYELIKKVIEKKQPHILKYSTINFLTQHADLIELAVNNGYKIRKYPQDDFEKIINGAIASDYELTKKLIEQGRLNIINYVTPEFFKKHIDLLRFIYNKGYMINLDIISLKKQESLKRIIASDYELTKRLIEEGQLDIIDYATEEFLNKHKDLIALALDNGYVSSFNFTYINIIDKIILQEAELIKKVIEQGQPHIINFLTSEFIIEHKELIKLAVHNNYEILPAKPGSELYTINQIIASDYELIKQAIEQDQPHIILYATEEFLKDNYNLLYTTYEKGDWEVLIRINEFIDISEILSNKQIKSLKKYMEIIDQIVGDEYKNYIIKNIESIDEEKIELIGDLFYRLATTNSKSLYAIRKSLAEHLQTLDNPVESFNKIENIFIRNNIPLYAKMFFCFKTLYPNLTNKSGNMTFDDYSRMSPELKDSTLVHTNIEKFINNPTNNDIRFYIIYNDLLRNAVKSNSTDLRKYLDNIELGDYLYKKILGENIINEKFDNLSETEKKEALEIFTSHLETIYHNTKEGKKDKKDISNYDIAQKIKYLKENFKTTNKYDLKDRIVRSFGYSAGYTSFKQIRNEMIEVVKEAHERGIKLSQQLENKTFEFEDGDFLRCIGNYQAFAGSIENGNFSKEFLTVFREINDSDTTPLDIDFSWIRKKESLYHSIEGTPTGFGFGNVYLIIKKDNPNLNITRDKDGNLTNAKYDPKKLEMFGTAIQGNGGYETHWGVRTGMSLTDVAYILFKEERQIDNEKPYNEDGTINYIGEPSPYDDLSKIKFEIARHGYYIPVIDFTGKIIFSVDEYNNLKEKMNGLSYYENNQFKFSNNLEIDGVKEITPYLDKSNEVTEIKRNKIYDVITPILEEHNLKLKTKIDGDLTPGSVEMIDTGSTGRGTNKIGDGDFDFLLRIDQKIFRDTQKYEQLKNDLKVTIEKYPHESCGITNNGDYRFKKVQLDKDTIVDIDLSFTIKTDKITYSTDECLKDRLKTIEKQDKTKYQQVVSNIILAKQVLKAGECYKPTRSDASQGGLGGSGIENWILQNGGSFKDAALDFLKTANTCNTFDEFKKQYYIWDFGENHFSERKGEYPHDNFIDNMNEIGYKKMKECLKNYLLNPEVIKQEDKESVRTY